MAVAAFTNSRSVVRFGIRRLSIAGLGTLVVLNLMHLAVRSPGGHSQPMELAMNRKFEVAGNEKPRFSDSVEKNAKDGIFRSSLKRCGSP
jgi:hypothetical protein